jgi:predicted RNA polymerase sigma factor
VYGALEALSELKKLANSSHFTKNHLFYAIEATLLSALKRNEEAIVALAFAIERTNNVLEKNHLTKKKQALEKELA